MSVDIRSKCIMEYIDLSENDIENSFRTTKINGLYKWEYESKGENTMYDGFMMKYVLELSVQKVVFEDSRTFSRIAKQVWTVFTNLSSDKRDFI